MKVCSWLIDLGSVVLADFGIEPAAGIQPARFAGQRQAPLAETLFQERFVQSRQVADLADAQRVQVFLRHLADAGTLAHIERRQKRGLLARDTHSTPFGLAWSRSDFRHQARGGDADGAIQLRLAPSSSRAAECAARSGGPCSRSVPVMSR